MKIISTHKEAFSFKYDDTTILNISSNEIEVTDAVAQVLEQRLGKNISISNSETPEPGDDTLENLQEEKKIAEAKAEAEKVVAEKVAEAKVKDEESVPEAAPSLEVNG